MGLGLGAAREHVRVARALRTLPQIDDALHHGCVSYSKVRALTRVATSENEAHLLAMARASTASQLERICRGYRLAVRNATPVTYADDDEERWVHERTTDHGYVRFTIHECLGMGRQARRLRPRRLRADGSPPPGGLVAPAVR